MQNTQDITSIGSGFELDLGKEFFGVYSILNFPNLLLRAIKLRNIDLVSFFISLGFSPDWKDTLGNSGLHIALKISNSKDRLNMVNIIFSKGANIYQENLYGESPISIASSYEDLDLIDFLENSRIQNDQLNYEKKNNIAKYINRLSFKNWPNFKNKLDLYYKKVISALSEEY